MITKNKKIAIIIVLILYKKIIQIWKRDLNNQKKKIIGMKNKNKNQKLKIKNVKKIKTIFTKVIKIFKMSIIIIRYKIVFNYQHLLRKIMIIKQINI